MINSELRKLALNLVTKYSGFSQRKDWDIEEKDWLDSGKHSNFLGNSYHDEDVREFELPPGSMSYDFGAGAKLTGDAMENIAYYAENLKNQKLNNKYSDKFIEQVRITLGTLAKIIRKCEGKESKDLKQIQVDLTNIGDSCLDNFQAIKEICNHFMKELQENDESDSYRSFSMMSRAADRISLILINYVHDMNEDMIQVYKRLTTEETL